MFTSWKGFLCLLLFFTFFTGEVLCETPNPTLKPPPAKRKIWANGMVTTHDSPTELRPEVEGKVTKIKVKENQKVRRGQLLLKLNPKKHRCEVTRANAELRLRQAELTKVLKGATGAEKAEAKAALWEAYWAYKAQSDDFELLRQPKLSQGIITPQELKRCENERNKLAAAVRKMRAKLKQLTDPPEPHEIAIAEAGVEFAQANKLEAVTGYKETKLKAPHDGIVIQKNIEKGELAGPGSHPVIVLISTNTIVEAYVEELDAPYVRVGMKADITADGFGGKTFRGRIYWVSKTMGKKTLFGDSPTEKQDTKVRTVKIEIDSKSELLVHGLRVDVIINPTARN